MEEVNNIVVLDEYKKNRKRKYINTKKIKHDIKNKCKKFKRSKKFIKFKKKYIEIMNAYGGLIVIIVVILILNSLS